MPTKFGADQIFVGPEMVLTAQNDAQLACVIGHELGHIEGGHTTSGAWVNVGKAALAILAEAAAAGALAYAKQGQPLTRSDMEAARGMGLLTSFTLAEVPLRLTGWERDQEREADALGVLFAHQAGLDPAQCAEFMVAISREKALAGADRGIWWWRIHPPSPERVVALRKLAEQAATGKLQRE